MLRENLDCNFSKQGERRHVGEHQAPPAVGNGIKEAYFFITPFRILKRATLTEVQEHPGRIAAEDLRSY